MHWGYLLSSFLLLLGGAFIDTVRGPLLPIFKDLFFLRHEQTSFFLSIASVSAVLCNFFLIPSLKYLGLKKSSMITGFFLIPICLFSYLVNSYFMLLLFGFLLGSTLAMQTTLANLLVVAGSTPQYRSKALCGLHVMYALGSILSPFCLKFILEQNFLWPNAFIFPLIAIFIFMFVLLRQKEIQQKFEMGKGFWPKSKWEWFIIFLFSIYVAGEVGTSMWMVTYFKALNRESIGFYCLSLFFVFLGFTRLISSFFVTPKNEMKIMNLSLILSLLGYTGIYIGFPTWVSCVGILGPIFPILSSMGSRAFEKDWPKLIIWTLCFVQLFLVIFHQLIGLFNDLYGVQIALSIPFILLIVTLLGLNFFYKNFFKTQILSV